jgi:DNA-binding SARP family transcriptional activator
VDLRILGPVEVWAGGQLVDIGPPQRRLVLAALLADTGRVVTAETLVCRAWGDDPPEGARRALHAHIARIRGSLAKARLADGGHATLARRSGGYVLDTAPELVDLHRFRRLVRRARDAACGPVQRAALLAEAVTLWRGGALAGVGGAGAAVLAW